MQSISSQSYPQSYARNKTAASCFRWLKQCLICFFFLPTILQAPSALADDDDLTLTDLIEHITTNFPIIAANITGDVKALAQTAQDGAAVVTYFMTYHQEDYEEFTDGSGCGDICEDFRDEIIDFINHYQDTLNLTPKTVGAMAKIQGLPPIPELPPINLSPLAVLLESAPAFLIYPFYDALSLIKFDGATSSLTQLNSIFTDTEAALTDLVAVGDAAGNDSTEYVNTKSCQWLVADLYNGDVAQLAAAGLTTVAGITSILSDVWYIKSLHQFNKINSGVSVAGEVTTSTDINALDKFSTVMNVTSKIFEGVGVGLASITSSCRVRLNNQLMFCMLATKNFHNNPKFNTLESCADRVGSGTEPCCF